MFVGGLAQSLTEQDLKAFFEEKFGPVSEVRIMMDKETDRSRGFGFITFEQSKTVSNLFDQLEGAPDQPLRIEGHPIDVKRAFPRAYTNRHLAQSALVPALSPNLTVLTGSYSYIPVPAFYAGAAYSTMMPAEWQQVHQANWNSRPVIVGHGSHISNGTFRPTKAKMITPPMSAVEESKSGDVRSNSLTELEKEP